MILTLLRTHLVNDVVYEHLEHLKNKLGENGGAC